VDVSLEGYKAVFKNRNIMSGFSNTIFYTAAGTAINLVVTTLAAYPLARRTLPYRKPLMLLFIFTMYFSGGMIPNYILLMQLGMLNTRWAILLPGALSVYNMILMRSFIEHLPGELYEAASIDGCSDITFLLRVTLPLSMPILAVLVLYYAVGHWNAYFNAMMYLTDQRLMPLQIILRDILVSNTIQINEIADEDTLRAKQGLSELLKYALIVISSLPVMMIYPFIQKYFIQGVMIGSLKG
ncbi:MAG TPA: carbohydrate ABC transporter permease, partial [Clostridia bacterium]|nr:carbohydrate ABC transporter permease [Clostridia bacterium]